GFGPLTASSRHCFKARSSLEQSHRALRCLERSRSLFRVSIGWIVEHDLVNERAALFPLLFHLVPRFVHVDFVSLCVCINGCIVQTNAEALEPRIACLSITRRDLALLLFVSEKRLFLSDPNRSDN